MLNKLFGTKAEKLAKTAKNLLKAAHLRFIKSAEDPTSSKEY
jgi:hypothetical protein